MRNGLLALLIMAMALWAGGCVSARAIIDPIPESDATLSSPAGKFHIAAIKCVNTSIADPKMAADNAARRERALLPSLRKECLAQYPALFADDPTGAIPLQVELSVDVRVHSGKMLGWMLGTAMLSGLVFPCPGDTDEEYSVAVSVWNGRPATGTAAPQTSFRRENYTWVSLLTPLALITIPGKSDVPKFSGTIIGAIAAEQEYHRQVAQQFATVLAKWVAVKDAAYWASQPRERSVSPLTTQGTPSVLPPPTGATGGFPGP